MRCLCAVVAARMRGEEGIQRIKFGEEDPEYAKPEPWQLSFTLIRVFFAGALSFGSVLIYILSRIFCLVVLFCSIALNKHS